ncbi:MAG: type III pantothenate kinase [Chloroflexi bacterium]|nr:MAG: type III pantothenate kinase [Chloroflexota bacterium]
MLLLIDIGNTNVVLGIWDGSQFVRRWRVATDRTRMPDEWWVVLHGLASSDGINLDGISGAILSSVVPSLTQWVAGMTRDRVGVDPLIVSAASNLGIKVRTDNPSEVGADRLVNAVAAFDAFGGPTVVIDFGTATNFDVISREGEYIGGAIAPGIRLAHDALVSRAAKLSSVELVFPERAIGSNTVTAMQSGIMLGYASLIDGMIERIDADLGERATVIATGGLGSIFSQACKRISAYMPDLTLDGLRIIWERSTASLNATER